MLGTTILVIFAVALYWTPTIVAWSRHVPDAGSVTVINAFLGWTLVGWVWALSKAVRTRYVPVAPYSPRGQMPPPQQPPFGFDREPRGYSPRPQSPQQAVADDHTAIFSREGF
jgi:Superinfection immunity protein